MFEKNKQKINAHNRKDRAARRYNLGLNEFSDLSEEEFAAIYTRLIPSDNDIRTTAKNIRDKISLEKNKCPCDEKFINEN